jgi:hypothetical protein
VVMYVELAAAVTVFLVFQTSFKKNNFHLSTINKIITSVHNIKLFENRSFSGLLL